MSYYNGGRIFAKKVRYDNYVFDSEMEYQRYLFLKGKEEKKEINDLKVHPMFELQKGYINFDGKTIKPINYEADFAYHDVGTNEYIVEDVKGMETEEFKLHRKIFDYLYKDKLSLKVIKWSKTTGFVPIEKYKEIMKTRKKQIIEEKNYYKNIVLKQEREKEKEKRKQEREIKRLEELSKLVHNKIKLTKAQQIRLNELQEKYGKVEHGSDTKC